jgi:hypothetical protein
MTASLSIAEARFLGALKISLLIMAITWLMVPSESLGQQDLSTGDLSFSSLSPVGVHTFPWTTEQTEVSSTQVSTSMREADDIFLPPPSSFDEHLKKSASAEVKNNDPWFSQVLPQGIIYRSYWAGVHEPRLGLQLISESGGGSFWDPTVGARIGLLRYGNDDPLHPQGWQLDIEGAAMARLTLDYWRDLDSVDFRGGVPLTYGIDNWQFKLGYYHLSSHLGDEYAINNPGSLAERVNYVRDAVVLGVSNYPVESMRLYAEMAYAFNATDGAEPWELQFGTELSRPGVTGPHGTPFFALNAHLREEHDFGGDLTTQTGWLWRDQTGHVLRIGAFYFNGKSSQYQFYNDSQQQVGGGIWYDF